MSESKKGPRIHRVDTKEFELPDTVFISDIDTQVFQGIVLQCLSEVKGISLVEGTFFDSILGRGGPEVGSAIQSEQDSANHSVSIKIEVDVDYGLSIPAKAEEIQSKVVEAITRLTGLHVSSVHIVFKNILTPDQIRRQQAALENKKHKRHEATHDDEYSDDF